MTNQQLAIRRNNHARLFKHSSTIKRNTIRLNVGNTYEHELKKFEICWDLQRQGKHYITEAETEDGIRADIVNLDDGICIELVKSESKASIKAKMAKYPLPIEVIKIKEEKQ